MKRTLLSMAMLLAMLPVFAATALPTVHVSTLENLKSALASNTSFEVILDQDIDEYYNSIDLHVIEVKGTKILNLDAHSINVSNDINKKESQYKYDARHHSLFYVPANASLTVRAKSDESSIHYDGYIINAWEDHSIPLRHIVEVDGGTFVLDNGSLMAGRKRWDKGPYLKTEGPTRKIMFVQCYDNEPVSYIGESFSVSEKHHRTGYNTIEGCAVRVTTSPTGKVVINGGYLEGFGVGHQGFDKPDEASRKGLINGEYYPMAALHVDKGSKAQIYIEGGHFMGSFGANAIWYNNPASESYMCVDKGTFEIDFENEYQMFYECTGYYPQQIQKRSFNCTGLVGNTVSKNSDITELLTMPHGSCRFVPKVEEKIYLNEIEVTPKNDVEGTLVKDIYTYRGQDYTEQYISFDVPEFLPYSTLERDAKYVWTMNDGVYSVTTETSKVNLAGFAKAAESKGIDVMSINCKRITTLYLANGQPTDTQTATCDYKVTRDQTPAVISYGLTVNGIAIDNYNQNDVLNDGGSVKYSPNSAYLRLEKANIVVKKQTYGGIVNKSVPNLTIYVAGECTITSDSRAIMTYEGCTTRVEGMRAIGDKLIIKPYTDSSAADGQITGEGTNIIACDMSVAGYTCFATCDLAINYSYVTMDARGGDGAMRNLKSASMFFCGLTEPVVLKKNTYGCYDLVDYANGKIVKTGTYHIEYCEVYPLTVAGVQVNAHNQNDILRDGGSVSFSPFGAMPHLTLNNATLNSGIVNNLSDGLIIELKGTNTISDSKVGIQSASRLRIEGNPGDKLTLNGFSLREIENSSAILMENGSELNLEASVQTGNVPAYGINGGRVYIDLEEGEDVSFYGEKKPINNVTYFSCGRNGAITKPTLGYFSASEGGAFDAGGYPVTREFVTVKPVKKYGVYVNGYQLHSELKGQLPTQMSDAFSFDPTTMTLTQTTGSAYSAKKGIKAFIYNESEDGLVINLPSFNGGITSYATPILCDASTRLQGNDRFEPYTLKCKAEDDDQQPALQGNAGATIYIEKANLTAIGLTGITADELYVSDSQIHAEGTQKAIDITSYVDWGDAVISAPATATYDKERGTVMCNGKECLSVDIKKVDHSVIITDNNDVVNDNPITDGVLTLTDGNIKQIQVLKTINVNTVNYQRKFTNSNWLPWFVPFDMPYTSELAKEFSFAMLAGALVDEEDGQIYVSFSTIKPGDIIRGNAVYMVKSLSATKYATTPKTFSVSNATLLSTGGIQPYQVQSSNYNFTFTGLYAPKQASATDMDWYYYNAKFQYCHAAATTKVGAFRFVFAMTERDDSPYLIGTAPATVGLKVDMEDVATAIKEVNYSKDTTGVYNIQGEKIADSKEQLGAINAPAGIYVINGKKVFIK